MNRTRINRGHTNHSSGKLRVRTRQYFCYQPNQRPRRALFGKLRVRTRSTFAINLTRGRAEHSSETCGCEPAVLLLST